MKKIIEETFCDRCGKSAEVKVFTQRNDEGRTQSDPPSGCTEREMDIAEICFSCAMSLIHRVIHEPQKRTFPADVNKWAHKPRTEFQ